LQLDRLGVDFNPIVNNNEILIEEKETLVYLVQLFNFYVKSKDSIHDRHKFNMLRFTNSEVYDIFNHSFITSLAKSDKEIFLRFTSGLFKLIKNGETTIFYHRIKFIPVYILESIILDKAPINNIEVFITIWLDNKKTEKENLFKFLLKLIIENYAISNESSLIVLEILKKLSPIFKCDSIVEDLQIKLDLIDLLSKQKIKLTLLELLRSEYLIINNKIGFNESDLYLKLCEYSYTLYKTRRRYSFIDDNIKSHQTIRIYLKRFIDIRLSNIILDMIKHNNLKSYILRILIDNSVYFNENVYIIEPMINSFIEARNEIDLSNEAIYTEFLTDINNFIQKFQNIDKAIIFNLQNIARFYKISSVFVTNSIDINLKDFDYKKLNFIDILEIFILKKFNIDQIIDLNDFLHKTEDIFEALGVERNEYLSLLFQFFFKYQKERLYTEILEYFVENDFKLFEECISKKNFDKKAYFVKYPKLKLRLLESTNRYEYLEEIIKSESSDIFKTTTVKFNTENEDLVCLLDLGDKIQNYPKDFEKINREEILKIARSGVDFKTKLVSFVIKACESLKSEAKKSTFKYSLHPKLVKLLSQVNYKHSGKEFEFNTKLSIKFKLYRYFIIKDLANLEDILEWENLTKLDSYSDLYNIHKLLINIHSEKINITQYINNELVKNYKSQLVKDLILFNLSYLKYFNIRHYNYIQILDKEYLKLEQSKLKIYGAIDSICDGKFNLILLVEDYRDLDNKLKNEMGKLYTNLTKNINYFIHSKLSEIDLLTSMEIYRHLNLNNFINFYKINAILDLKVNINLLMAIKLCVNLNNISCVVNQAKRGSTEIIQILSSIHITDDEFKLLSNDLFNLPTVNFILEAHMNINILEKNYHQSLQDFITTKLILVDELLNKVPILAKWPILMDKLKILRIKHHILHNIDDSEVITTYNNIKDLSDYSEIESIYRRNDRMKEQIRNIYTKLN
jgi:hypothetical protein